MIAGLVLKEFEKEDSFVAFLGDGTECFTVKSNRDIADLIKEREPDVLASDVGVREPRNDRTRGEEELEEEGYAFIPAKQDTRRVRRMEALKSLIFEEMGSDAPEIIRFDPYITADELAIHSDDDLGGYGVETSGIESSKQFDAVLGAVTARFYQKNSVRDLGVVVPEPV